jgi:hypothetical protein
MPVLRSIEEVILKTAVDRFEETISV